MYNTRENVIVHDSSGDINAGEHVHFVTLLKVVQGLGLLQGAITHNCQCDNIKVCGSLYCAQMETRFTLGRYFVSQVV